ncbi:MAG TPA: hypothetical protein VMF88_15500 [Bacteroidota bacterium]|nr:hypothetical protein [Bacteroidota bacterium]
MKSYQFSIKTIVCCAIFAFMGFSCNGWNGEYGRHTKRVLLGANEVHEGWYFGGGDDVVIDGTINGDAYIAGGTVDVEGTINGDLIVAGGMLTLNGKVTEHIRAAGGTIWLDGEAGKDVSAAGGTIRVGRKALLDGNLLAACGTMDVQGKVSKEAKIASGDASVSGSIGGDLKFAGNRLSIPDGGHVLGNVSAVVKDKELVSIADHAVAGSVDISLQQPEKRAEILGLSVWRFWLKVFWFFGLVFFGAAVTILVPNQLRQLGQTVVKEWGMSAVWGILAMICVPIAAFMLCLTLIGIPLAILLLTIFAWVLYCSQFALAIVVAQQIFTLEGKERYVLFGALLVGLIIVQIATAIPVLGVLVALAGCILGVGGILLVVKEMWMPSRIQVRA